jgi:hypothetical protein
MVFIQTKLSEGTVVHAVQECAWPLLGAALIGILARRVRIPYAVALVLGGLRVEESLLVAVALGLPLSVALLFGSAMAATNSVAVTAILKEAVWPARLLSVTASTRPWPSRHPRWSHRQCPACARANLHVRGHRPGGAPAFSVGCGLLASA